LTASTDNNPLRKLGLLEKKIHSSSIVLKNPVELLALSIEEMKR
jgi:hypothetical protein